MKKEHKKFLKVIRKLIKSRPDLSLYEIIVYVLANQPHSESGLILLNVKQRVQKLINDVNKKEENNSTKEPSAGRSGGLSSDEE